MTRKRFVKLLMSKGVSRNQANGIAQQYISEGISYESGYRIWKLSHFLKDPMAQIGEVVNRATVAIQSLVSAIGAAASAFSSVLSVSLQQPSPFGGRCPRCYGTGVERRMQAMATFDGPSIRGPDLLSVCPRCFGTGRDIV